MQFLDNIPSNPVPSIVRWNGSPLSWTESESLVVSTVKIPSRCGSAAIGLEVRRLDKYFDSRIAIGDNTEIQSAGLGRKLSFYFCLPSKLYNIVNVFTGKTNL